MCKEHIWRSQQNNAGDPKQNPCVVSFLKQTPKPLNFSVSFFMAFFTTIMFMKFHNIFFFHFPYYCIYPSWNNVHKTNVYIPSELAFQRLCLPQLLMLQTGWVQVEERHGPYILWDFFGLFFFFDKVSRVKQQLEYWHRLFSCAFCSV